MKYEIKNQPFSVITFNMERGESIKCQSGAMAWMSPSIRMETKTGGFGKMFKRAISGESLALNHYTADAAGELTLAKHCPGDILTFDVSRTPIIAQKTSFLASTENVENEIHFQKKISVGFFGGEGFLMQKFSGNGIVFIEIDGSTIEYNLEPGQQMLIDTGYLAMMDATVKMEIQKIKGLKNVMLGGEGLFNTLVTGPGRVVIQTMPISGFAAFIASLLPRKS